MRSETLDQSSERQSDGEFKICVGTSNFRSKAIAFVLVVVWALAGSNSNSARIIRQVEFARGHWPKVSSKGMSGENLASIRRKIKAALLDMPASDDIRQILIGSKLDYFKSKMIVDVLKSTEADTKNIFGFYSSQRMKDWQDIVRCYERDYIYLAELCGDLIRETNYEIPGIKRMVQKLKMEKEELEKAKSSLIRRAEQSNSEHRKLAQSYAMQGVDIVGELTNQLNALPDVMDRVVQLCKDLHGGLEFYREFASKTIPDEKSSELLPTLHNVIVNDKLVYEDRKIRNRFVNDLYELDAFYKQLSSDGSNTEQASKVTSKIKTILDIFNEERNKVLFQMNDSPTFIENICEKFDTKIRQATNFSDKADMKTEQIEDVDKQIRDTEIHVKKSIATAKELKQKVESTISEIYKGRTINIMGCVN